MKGFVLITLLCLVSCNGSSGGSKSNSVQKRSINFSDSTVSNFTQISGVASLEKQWYQYIIESAYAASGSISCVDGSNVEVVMDVTLGGSTNSLNATGVCGDDIELQIRRKMLSALDGHKMILEVAGSGNVGPDYNLDFQSSGFAYDTPYKTLEDEKTTFSVTQNCYIDYTFNLDTGKVKSNISSNGDAKADNEAANTTWGFSNPRTPNDGNGNTGCRSADGEYRTADFRFKDGKIEMDESGLKKFDPRFCVLRDSSGNIIDSNFDGSDSGVCPNSAWDSPYERWCIDDNSDGNCD